MTAGSCTRYCVGKFEATSRRSPDAEEAVQRDQKRSRSGTTRPASGAGPFVSRLARDFQARSTSTFVPTGAHSNIFSASSVAERTQP